MGMHTLLKPDLFLSRPPIPRLPTLLRLPLDTDTPKNLIAHPCTSRPPAMVATIKLGPRRLLTSCTRQRMLWAIPVTTILNLCFYSSSKRNCTWRRNINISCSKLLLEPASVYRHHIIPTSITPKQNTAITFFIAIALMSATRPWRRAKTTEITYTMRRPPVSKGSTCQSTKELILQAPRNP